MKKNILILFLLIQTFCFSQKYLSGVYTNTKEDRSFETDIFEFKKNGSFKYAFFTCTGFGIGIGKYEIIKSDSLKLNFENIEDFSIQNELKFGTTPSDSLKINIKTIYADKNGYTPGVNFAFVNSNKGFATDFDGTKKISFKLNEITNKIEAFSIGIKRIQFNIPKGTTVIEGNVLIYPNYWDFKSIDKKIFAYVNLNQHNFKLKRYKNHEVQYVKISKTQMNKSIKSKVGDYFYSTYYKKYLDN